MSTFLNHLNITGGIPVKNDLGASILFLVLYAALVPIIIFRFLSIHSRTSLLIRPAVFIAVRLATFSIRIVQSEGNYSTGLFIAQQILLLCGFILLVEPLLTLLQHHPLPPVDQHTILFHRVIRLLKLALIAALALGVYAGSNLANLDNPSTLKAVKDARVANSGICLGITVLAFCLALVSYHRFDNPLRPTSILLYLAFFLTLASIYKLVIYVIPPLDPFRQSPKTLFYIFNSLPEFICTAIYVGVNLNEEFGILGVEKRDQIKEGV